MFKLSNLETDSKFRDFILVVVSLISIVCSIVTPIWFSNFYNIWFGLLVATFGAVALATLSHTIKSDNSEDSIYKLVIIYGVLLITIQFLFAPTQIMGFLPGIKATSYSPDFSQQHLQDILLPIMLLFVAESLSLITSTIILKYSCYSDQNKSIFKAITQTVLFAVWGYLVLLVIQYWIAIWIGIIVTYISGVMLVALTNISELSSEI
ncbi:hypothetical protein [Halorubrum sp. DM2]|uniref:hypothetical protein n=1 Tax=Halorubrum sp. DM2 TaxID=2527867 RepID=UPI0024B64D81|nr:hypothetical protein [Halorubrum sp. DM2]